MDFDINNISKEEAKNILATKEDITIKQAKELCLKSGLKKLPKGKSIQDYIKFLKIQREEKKEWEENGYEEFPPQIHEWAERMGLK